MRTKLLPFRSLRVILALSILVSCQKEIRYDLDITEQPPVAEPSIWKTTGVTGQVIDAGGMPIEGADVKFGGSVTKTDNNGYFSFAAASFSTQESFVTVEKPGYFKGSRTFFARKESNNYLKIKLIAQRLVATIDGGVGGDVEVRGGMKVTLPANGIVTQGGDPYTGPVHVFASYLDPTADDINERMPGDLRGVTTNGQQRILKSLGMVAVELVSQNRQSVKLREGSKAKLTFPVPGSLAASAPATVPLWYFDDATGLWVEEGVAVRQGNEYIGEVSHFSFWNVDIPSEFIKLSIKIVGPENDPVAGAKVKLTSSVAQDIAYDFTDNTGYVTGGVPKGQSLKMEIFDNCGKIVTTETIGPFTTDTDLGNKKINSKVPLQTIYGTVEKCDGSLLAQGNIQVLLSPQHSQFAVIEDGKFRVTFLSCDGVGTAQLIATDDNNLQQGNPETIQLDTVDKNAGRLKACGVQINSYVNLTINGVSKTWNSQNNNLIEAYTDTSASRPGWTDLWLMAGDTLNFASAVEPFKGIQLLAFLPPGNIITPADAHVEVIIEEMGSGLEAYAAADSIFRTMRISSFNPVGQFIGGTLNGRFITLNRDTVTINGNFFLRRKAIWW